MWKVIGASVPGSAHLRAGRGCDDASQWIGGTDVMCLTVADGAGSRPLSSRGSRIAVDTVAELAAAVQRGDSTEADPGAWLTAVFVEVHRRIAEAAGGRDHDRHDYATTLAVAVLIGDQIAIGQVGDTIAVVGGPGGYVSVAPAPQYEYANETVFVTQSDFGGHLRVETVPADGVDEVYLSTDGLRYKILDDLAKSVPYEPFFADLGAYARTPAAGPKSIEKFLTTVDDQTGDDLSLVVAVRTDGAGSARPPNHDRP
jgi:hypothetical protein